MEVKGRGFFSTVCEDSPCVGKGWLMYIGIHQLSKCIRIMGAVTLALERGISDVGRKETGTNSEVILELEASM